MNSPVIPTAGALIPDAAGIEIISATSTIAKEACGWPAR